MARSGGVSVTLPVTVRSLESAKCWSEWQDLNLRPPRPERGANSNKSTRVGSRDTPEPPGIVHDRPPAPLPETIIAQGVGLKLSVNHPVVPVGMAMFTLTRHNAARALARYMPVRCDNQRVRSWPSHRPMNTVYVIAIVTSLNCGVEVLSPRAIEPDSTGQHAQTYPTQDACIAALPNLVLKAQRDATRQLALQCVPKGSALPYDSAQPNLFKVR